MIRTSADEDPTNVRTKNWASCDWDDGLQREMAKQREASDNSETAMRETVMGENSE